MVKSEHEPKSTAHNLTRAERNKRGFASLDAPLGLIGPQWLGSIIENQDSNIEYDDLAPQLIDYSVPGEEPRKALVAHINGERYFLYPGNVLKILGQGGTLVSVTAEKIDTFVSAVEQQADPAVINFFRHNYRQS